jgi:subtilisin family serine protease
VIDKTNQPASNLPDEKQGGANARPRDSRVSPSLFPLDIRKQLEPELGFIQSLIALQDWQQLKARTGIDQASAMPQRLPLFLAVKKRGIEMQTLIASLNEASLHVPSIYLKPQADGTAPTRMTAYLLLKAGDPSQIILDAGKDATGKIVYRPLDAQLIQIIGGDVFRIGAARSHQPCLEDSLSDIGLLPARGHKGHVLRGNGIVVGVIDDGCAFAHRHFLKTLKNGDQIAYNTRVLYLWDQATYPSAADQAVGWTAPADLGYGRELAQDAIDAAIAQRVTSEDKIEEDAIYAYLRYQVGTLGDMASHGTHVMDIAAGNGQSLMGSEGVAPEADIIFVQLPTLDIENPGPALDQHIVDGVQYIFERAKGQPVVINISFGGYSGPHDGTSYWESTIDSLIVGANKAAVVSAGNGFEAECHACGTLLPGQDRSLGWFIKPADPTFNDLEIWYDRAATLTVSLSEPDTGNVYGPYSLGTDEDIARPSDGKIIGHVMHSQPNALDGDKTVLIALRPIAETPDQGDDTATLELPWAPARPGRWAVTLKSTDSSRGDFHAWIQRDDIGRYGSRRQQSRFVPEDAYPGYTIGDFATGRRTIAVGAYNTGTQEVCEYSACGPTRPSASLLSRQKPDLCAPAAEDAAGRGVLAASSLRAQPTRFSGTSASAPHVTGLVALILEYAVKYGTGSIDADKIRNGLASAANKALKYGSHQEADDDYKIKQRDVWNDLVGGGKVDFAATMNILFP